MAPASPDHASFAQPAIQRQDPSQEPSALAVHAGICAGGRPSQTGEGRSLPRPFGHVRQLDRVLAVSLARAWAAGAGPGDDRLVVDVDSFVGEVFGAEKQGAGYGYTHKLGYHPILATRAETGEVLHIRARKGSANTSRGALRFVEELIPRVARAGASGEKLLRADSGFWNVKIMTRLHAAGWTYSIGVRQQTAVKTAISAIPEADWQALPDYPETGEAQIAETILGARRLIVRRARLIGAQAELWPDWRHFAFLTNRVDALELVEAEHRQHAVGSSRSATSKTKRWRTSRPASFSPTPPGP
jgi:hypothetical protein